MYLPTDGSAFLKPNNSNFITNNFKSPLAIWKMLFMIIVVNLLYSSMTLKVRQLSTPIRTMMENVNNLMDSENYLLETYFDFKSKFIIEQNFEVESIFFDNLLKSQQNSEVIFNQISVQSLELFPNFDSSYTKEFIELLINKTCELTKS